MHSSPVRHSPPTPCGAVLPFDLHVLGMPPAFNLSQDQTLRFSLLDPKVNSYEAFTPTSSRSSLNHLGWTLASMDSSSTRKAPTQVTCAHCQRSTSAGSTAPDRRAFRPTEPHILHPFQGPSTAPRERKVSPGRNRRRPRGATRDQGALSSDQERRPLRRRRQRRATARGRSRACPVAADARHPAAAGARGPRPPRHRCARRAPGACGSPRNCSA